MMKKLDLSKVNWQKVVGVVGCVVTGVAAFSQALGDQKREAEFEEMKKALSELKGKES